MDLTRDERLELLKLELSSLQGIFNKYDDLIYRLRNWFIYLYAGGIGVSFLAKVPELALLAASLGVLYWLLEGMFRYKNWFKYVLRYRSLRDALNAPDGEATFASLSVFDLTGHFDEEHRTAGLRFRKSFFKSDALILYLSMALGGVLAWYLATAGYVAP